MARKEATSASAGPSTTSAVTATAKEPQIHSQGQQNLTQDGIDNYDLPKALVTRIAKSSIPESSKLQKDTVTALVKGSTVFINFLAATAHDIASSRQHKSVSASDVLKALETIQFGDMVEPLQHELNVYRENVKGGKRRTTTNTNGSSASVSKGSLSAGVKSKGKERAPSALSNSVSAADIDAGAASGGAGEDNDVDMVTGEAGEADEDELDDEQQEDAYEAEDNDEEEDEEPEELVDQMALEEEEERDDFLVLFSLYYYDNISR